MAKQATITEIARRAGVSIGTVDRVLHNRAGVSAKSREKIQAILDEAGYKVNLHTSAIALKKEFHILISVPHAAPGEYWDTLLKGVMQAKEEYSDIFLRIDILPYDQFDPVSCREVFSGIAEESPDAVIIGPTFEAETHLLCGNLDAARIPYIFVDTTIPETRPVASFTADQPAGGSLVGRLLDSIVPKDKKLVLVSSHVGGNGKAQNSEQRRSGLRNYLEGKGDLGRLLEAQFDMRDNAGKETSMRSFFDGHPDIGGVCVLNSRGYSVADFLRAEGRGDIAVVAFDLTENNERCLRNGSIQALVCQRPDRQGFLAVTTMLEYMLYHRTGKGKPFLMPLDIVMKENLPFYK